MAVTAFVIVFKRIVLFTSFASRILLLFVRDAEIDSEVSEVRVEVNASNLGV